MSTASSGDRWVSNAWSVPVPEHADFVRALRPVLVSNGRIVRYAFWVRKSSLGPRNFGSQNSLDGLCA